jgi:hypothetical protein
MTGVEMVTLHARTWVQLPGTPYEVLLHGKTGELLVRRTGGRYGGWSLPSTVYVRRTNPPDGEES